MIAEDLKDFKRFTPKTLPQEEPLVSGHRACQGCGEVLALRMVAKAIGVPDDCRQCHRVHGDHLLPLSSNRLGRALDSRGL